MSGTSRRTERKVLFPRERFLVAILAIGQFFACAVPPVPKAATVTPVAIVSWPTNPKPDCFLTDLPAPPEVKPIIAAQAEVALHRIYVTYSQMSDVAVWLKDLHHWHQEMLICMRKIVEAP